MTGRVVRDGDYLSASGAAEILHVSPKTVTRWAQEGRLEYTKTLGGHRRFSREYIEGLADNLTQKVTA